MRLHTNVARQSQPAKHFQMAQATQHQIEQRPICRRCKARPATEVDHITPLAEAPDRRYDYDNLSSLCHDCHQAKTAQESRRGKDRAR